MTDDIDNDGTTLHESGGVVQPTDAQINGEAPNAHNLLAALIDIYDDMQDCPPEHRCYVPEAWGDTLRMARQFLAVPQALLQAEPVPDPVRIEPGPVYALLRRALGQLAQWQKKYGEHNPQWLPPAGDVRLAEDIDAMLNQIPGAQAEPVPVVASEMLNLEAVVDLVRRVANAGYGYGPKGSREEFDRAYAISPLQLLVVIRHVASAVATPQAEPAVAEQARRDVCYWLESALKCPHWQWEHDQREFAQMALDAALASQSTPPPESAGQGLSDAFAGMDIGQTWTKEHSITYPQSAANIINAARAILAANPTAQPDGGSKA